MEQRTRWTDERIDDFAAGVRDDIGEIKGNVERILSDEMQRLRERVATAEQQVDQVGTQRREDIKFNKAFWVSIIVPIGLGALGTVIPLVATGVI